jgi:hypothetical protein
MRELIEYLVARGGAEAAEARMAAGTHHQFLCTQFPRKEDRSGHALIEGESIGAGVAIGKAPGIVRTPADSVLTGSVLTNSPIIIVYPRARFTDDAVEEIAGAIPDFDLLD